jgi:hypothetical protein
MLAQLAISDRAQVMSLDLGGNMNKELARFSLLTERGISTQVRSLFVFLGFLSVYLTLCW